MRTQDEESDSTEATLATTIFAARSITEALQEWGCGETASTNNLRSSATSRLEEYKIMFRDNGRAVMVAVD